MPPKRQVLRVGNDEEFDPKALRALAHPVRMRLLDELGKRERITATEAAEILNTTPANCSFHLRQLARYGMVEPDEASDNREHPWKLAPFRQPEEDPVQMLLARLLYRFSLYARTKELKPEYGIRSVIGKLDTKQVVEIVERFEELADEVDKDAEGELIELVLISYPLK